MVPRHKMDPKPLKWSHTFVGLAHKAPLHEPCERHTAGVLMAKAGILLFLYNISVNKKT